MHVENRVIRAHALAQEYIASTEAYLSLELENETALQFLLAELINAVQGLDYDGNPLK